MANKDVNSLITQLKDNLQKAQEKLDFQKEVLSKNEVVNKHHFAIELEEPKHTAMSIVKEIGRLQELFSDHSQRLLEAISLKDNHDVVEAVKSIRLVVPPTPSNTPVVQAVNNLKKDLAKLEQMNTVLQELLVCFKQSNSEPIKEEEPQYDSEVDKTSDGFYLGEALPGSEIGKPVWRIQRIIQDRGSIRTKWANGNPEFDKAWTKRKEFSY